MTYVTPDYTMSTVAKLVGYKGRKFMKGIRAAGF